jgi:hypothetical protein
MYLSYIFVTFFHIFKVFLDSLSSFPVFMDWSHRGLSPHSLGRDAGSFSNLPVPPSDFLCRYTQVFKVCWVSSMFQDNQYWSQFLRKPTEKLGHWMYQFCFLERLGSGNFACPLFGESGKVLSGSNHLMVAHTCNASTWDVDTGRSGVDGQPKLH